MHILDTLISQPIQHFVWVMVIWSILLFIVALPLTKKISAQRKYSQYLFYLVFFGIFIAPSYITSLCFAIITVLMLYEIHTILKKIQPAYRSLPLEYLAFCLLPLIPFAYEFLGTMAFTLGVLYLILIAGVLVVTQDTTGAYVKFTLAGLTLLAALSINLFALLRTFPQGKELCLFLLFLINLTDTTAMLGGMFFGKRPLAAKLSPKKTVAGVVVSLFATTGFAYLFNWVLLLNFSWQMVLVLGLGINIAALLGDLFTSLFKRELSIKDYGTIIPGHGGILDRFDSCLFCLPLFMLFLGSVN